MHHRCALIYGSSKLIRRFNLDEFDPGGSQLVIERVAMRLLDDHFRLHAGQVGQLTNQCLVSASQNARQSRLNRRRRARRHQRGVTIRQLEHFRDALARSYFQLRNAYKVAPS